MTDVRVLLAKNLKKIRESLNLSQMEMAEKVGCSPTLIGKIETLKRFPSAATINRITKGLKISTADLFVDSDNSLVVKTFTSKQKRKAQFKSKLNNIIDEYFS